MQTGDFARERPTLVETLISLADRARKAAAMSEQKFEDQVQLAKGGADKEVKSPGRQTTQWIYRRRGAWRKEDNPINASLLGRE